MLCKFPQKREAFWRKPGKAGNRRRIESGKISIFSSGFPQMRQKSTKCSKRKRRISCDNTKGNRKSGKSGEGKIEKEVDGGKILWYDTKRLEARASLRRRAGEPSYATVAQSVEQLIRNYQTGPQKIEYATVAQSVEQLIRNQQVVCSSHISSSRKRRKSFDFRRFCNFSGKQLTHI